MIPALLLALATPQAHAEACPATPVPLPAGLEGWAHRKSVKAGASPSGATELTLGNAATAALLPTARVTYAVPPEKPGSPASSGGLFAFTAPAAGRYRVALGAGAWIDVLSGETPAVSVAHGHGPDCSTVRKMVDFDLRPGRYLLQVAGNGTSTLPLMVARLP